MLGDAEGLLNRGLAGICAFFTHKQRNAPFLLNFLGIRNLVWVLAPWVFVAITFKEWILVLDG